MLDIYHNEIMSSRATEAHYLQGFAKVSSRQALTMFMWSFTEGSSQSQWAFEDNIQWARNSRMFAGGPVGG